MTARWEPLETAEDVESAFQAGRKVQVRAAVGDSAWYVCWYVPSPDMALYEYRALIEDSK